MGLNLQAKAYFSSHFDMQAGITWQSSRYKTPETWSDDPDVPAVRRMFRTPDLYGYLTANWEITHKLKVALSGTYTGHMLVQHLAGSGTPVDVAVETPNFFDASLKFTYTFKVLNLVTLNASAGVSNIFNSYQRDFDKGVDRDSGYIYGPSLPRSVNIGLSISI